MNYQDFISLAQKKGITNIQITIETSRSNEIYYINDTLEDYSDISKTIYSIKAEYNGKVEHLQTEYLDESIIDLLIEKINLVDTSYQEDFLDKRTLSGATYSKEVSTKEEISKIKELYKMKEKYPLIKSIEFAFSDDYEETKIINSKGLDLTTSSHVYKFITEAVAQKNNESASYDRSILVTDKSKIDFENMTKEVLEMATLQVSKRKLETKKYDIVLDNNVVNAILSSLKNMLSSQSIRKKTSCLTDQINKNIFSKHLSIHEEPLNAEHPGYTLFDKEGTNTFNKVIIEKGTLKTYLYDNKEAKLSKITSTGNSYGQISTRNMYIEPTNKPVKELLEIMKDGIYITDKMGASGTSINESTGNISIQIFGYIVENGKIVCGFNPAIMSTTIYELLSNIEAVGSDLTFRRKDIGCPSLYIRNISIASE